MTLSPTDPRAALRHRNFRFYLSARFLSITSHQILAVAMSQYIYELTHSPIHLGYIGLALFIPKIAFTLLAGHVADRYDRRLVILYSLILAALAMLLLIVCVSLQMNPLWLLYVILFLIGTSGAFGGPASQSIVPQLVPPVHFSNAVTWNASVMQIAFIVGPALSGLLYAASGSPLFVFAIIGALRLAAVGFIYIMKSPMIPPETSELSWKTALAGIAYIRNHRVILGIISLDLFAVLLGGAVALLPVFANDILHVGPSGFGILRAAPAIGAAVMAIALAHLPPIRRAGPVLLMSIAVFGAATILFGLSRHFVLSVMCLCILGAADMISVVIRGVLVQLKTPPAMRGRVSAVNLIFIGASNELGEFESGLTAHWFGVVPAVLIGGVGTLAIVALWARRFPEIRHYGELDEPHT